MTENRARQLQVALFVQNTGHLKADRILADLFNEEADLVQTNRIPSPEAPFLSTARLATDDFMLMVNVSPGRVDVIYHPRPNVIDFDASRGLAHVQTLLASGNLDVVGPLYRVALAGTFVTPVDSEEIGISKVFGFLRAEPPATESSEVFFRINLLGSAGPDGIKVNRLLQLGVDTLQEINLIANMAGSPVVGQQFFLSRTVDVNTVPVAGAELSSASAIEILRYFIIEVGRLSVADDLEACK